MALTLCSQTHQPQRVSVRFRRYVVEPGANALRLMGCEPQSECHWADARSDVLPLLRDLKVCNFKERERGRARFEMVTRLDFRPH